MADDVFYRLLFIGLYGLFFIVRGYYRFFKPREEEPEKEEEDGKVDHGIGAVVISIAILGYFASVILYLVGIPVMDLFQYDLYPLVLRWIGVALVLVMIPFLAWIHRTLNRQYSAYLRIKSEHKLIMEGPYSRVRHPMYTVLSLFSFGEALITANSLIILFAILIFISFPMITRHEEKMMTEEFGEQYVEYMKRTGGFLPRIRRVKSE